MYANYAQIKFIKIKRRFCFLKLVLIFATLWLNINWFANYVALKASIIIFESKYHNTTRKMAAGHAFRSLLILSMFCMILNRSCTYNESLSSRIAPEYFYLSKSLSKSPNYTSVGQKVCRNIRASRRPIHNSSSV